jgi:hypothetical protein
MFPDRRRSTVLLTIMCCALAYIVPTRRALRIQPTEPLKDEVVRSRLMLLAPARGAGVTDYCLPPNALAWRWQ